MLLRWRRRRAMHSMRLPGCSPSHWRRSLIWASHSCASRTAIAGVGPAAVAAGACGLELADKYETAHARLESAVQNSGHKLAEFSKATDKQHQSFEALGDRHDQYEAALARRTQARNDPKK